MTDRHLISRDELLAAGALDVPPAWRKTLGVDRDRQQRTLFTDLLDDDLPPELPQSNGSETEDDVSSDDVE